MHRRLLLCSWATPFLVSLLLFATSGTALSRMTCLISGNTTLEWGQMADCCPEQEDPDTATFNAQCCVMSAAAPDRSPFLPVTTSVLYALPAVALAPVYAERWPELEVFTASKWSAPPPLEAGLRRALSATFRI